MDSHRLFFALWPSTPVRHSLVIRARGLLGNLSGRPTRPESLHMTLTFIGNTPEARLNDVIAAADSLTPSAFNLALDHSGVWRNGVLWVGPDSIPLALAEFQGALDQNLRGAGFALDRRPFAPHVTLARNVRPARPAVPIPAIDWPCREFVLVTTHLDPAGARYEILRRWPLQQ